MEKTNEVKYAIMATNLKEGQPRIFSFTFKKKPLDKREYLDNYSVTVGNGTTFELVGDAHIAVDFFGLTGVSVIAVNMENNVAVGIAEVICEY
jgi:hypothetical protein